MKFNFNHCFNYNLNYNYTYIIKHILSLAQLSPGLLFLILFSLVSSVHSWYWQCSNTMQGIGLRLALCSINLAYCLWSPDNIACATLTTYSYSNKLQSPPDMRKPFKSPAPPPPIPGQLVCLFWHRVCKDGYGTVALL